MYNALKLFMDTNPALFEECTQRYQREVQAEAQKQEERQQQWARIEQMAHSNPLYEQVQKERQTV